MLLAKGALEGRDRACGARGADGVAVDPRPESGWSYGGLGLACAGFGCGARPVLAGLWLGLFGFESRRCYFFECRCLAIADQPSSRVVLKSVVI